VLAKFGRNLQLLILCDRTSLRVELESKIFGYRQGTLSVSKYYGKLKGLWIELDQYQNLKLENSKEAITLAQFVERSRIFKFLSGLNPEYDPVRLKFLGRKDFLLF